MNQKEAMIYYVKNKEQYDDLLKQRQDYISSDDPASTRQEPQMDIEMEDQYVLHNPQQEEHPEYLAEYKIYDNKSVNKMIIPSIMYFQIW